MTEAQKAQQLSDWLGVRVGEHQVFNFFLEMNASLLLATSILYSHTCNVCTPDDVWSE